MAEETQKDQQQGNSFTNTLHTIFLAGVGAVAATGEKGSELFEQLVKKGEDTVNEGKQKNDELLKKAQGKVSGTAEEALKAYLKSLSPDDREQFVASVQKAAEDAGANAQKMADDASDVAQKVAAEAATLQVEANEEAKNSKDAPTA